MIYRKTSQCILGTVICHSNLRGKALSTSTYIYTKNTALRMLLMLICTDSGFSAAVSLSIHPLRRTDFMVGHRDFRTVYQAAFNPAVRAGAHFYCGKEVQDKSEHFICSYDNYASTREVLGCIDRYKKKTVISFH